ncbi:MAG TPA: NAD-glutamate dehydrogenase domain-containing protein, partial [Pseudonocardia sp.]
MLQDQRGDLVGHLLKEVVAVILGDLTVPDGLVDTDFIDNSAGVDTSDHEVNIKILLDRAVRDGEITRDGRNDLLQQMTDEVAALVLQ